MSLTPQVQTILDKYEGETPGVKKALAKMLNHGKLGGTGKMVILPVDQGFEHGPARSFAVNPAGYDPHYHYQLAIDSGCSAYAAPLGALEAGMDTFKGKVPTILKVNSSNSLDSKKRDTNQAITANIKDAVRLGVTAVGFTIYPGSDNQFDLFEEVRDMISEAREHNIASVVWSYPRGGTLTAEAETAMDVVAYSAHMAALLGAHIIKVKLPAANIYQKEAQKVFEDNGIPIATQTDRVREVVRSCFNGRRIVVFSGGATKGENAVYEDAIAIRDGGGNGSIIGRNSFQRKEADAHAMLNKIMDIYKGN